MAKASLGLTKVRVGPDEFNLGQKEATNVQTRSKNPVWNPPFNNWSVNQPSTPHATGLNAYEDLGQNIIVDGHKVHFGQREHPTNLAQMIPLTDDENVPGNFYVQEHDANHSPL